jgi:hypothetical protein
MSEQTPKSITAYTYDELENEKEAFSSAEIAAELEKRRRDARLAGYKGELIHPDSAHAEVEANTNGHYVYLHTTVLKQETRIEELEAQLAEAQKLAAPQELRKIGELLRTQDDQFTADAIFIVERKRIVTGFDTDYCESHQIVWAIEDRMYFEGEDYFKELEDEFKRTEKQREYHTRTGFIVHWDFVQLFFTQSAADEFIAKHGHKYGGDLRFSVEGAYRNNEFQTVRNWLMSLPSTQEQGK